MRTPPLAAQPAHHRTAALLAVWFGESFVATFFAGCVLEPRQPLGRGVRHGRRSGGDAVLPPPQRRLAAGLFGVTAPPELWFAVLPVSAGVFGVPLGFVLCALVSLMTPSPAAGQRAFVRELRYPKAD